ncbi:MAG: PTS ascorbate transporter subunit IIC [Anaerolineaceae bacterium]|nr:PTS ascorbate transporter subunit IIC [Anaerolineaceae bacterium]
MDLNIVFAIVPRLLPTFMLGIVALVGLLLQRKTFSQTLVGTIKTMAGVIILFTAVDLLSATISPISTMFSQVYQIEGQPTVDFTGFLASHGVQVVLVLVLGFLVNLLLARITKFKYVFLTGHILFWNAFMVVAALGDTGKITGVALVVIGSIILGIISTFLPALIAPFVKKVTGTSDFTIGHTTTSLSIVGAWVGQLFGDKSKSTEELAIPEGLAFMKEMVISTSVIMMVLYLVMGLIAGPAWSAATFAGGSVVVWILWAIYQSISFGAALVILLTGVRMMLGEIIPAFNGIAKKIVPEAVPALDCPMVFPYAPNALAIGFPIAMIASLITLVIFGLVGVKFVLLPLVVAAFFDVGPAAIMGNATGGVRGAVLASIVGGILLIVLQALSIPFVANSAAGFINAFGGNDFSLIAIVVGGLARLFGF